MQQDVFVTEVEEAEKEEDLMVVMVVVVRGRVWRLGGWG
jgi:hypothetical protein